MRRARAKTRRGPLPGACVGLGHGAPLLARVAAAAEGSAQRMWCARAARKPASRRRFDLSRCLMRHIIRRSPIPSDGKPRTIHYKLRIVVVQKLRLVVVQVRDRVSAELGTWPPPRVLQCSVKTTSHRWYQVLSPSTW